MSTRPNERFSDGEQDPGYDSADDHVAPFEMLSAKGELPAMNPITGMAGCCARAASG
jgi:hypothetical protein